MPISRITWAFEQNSVMPILRVVGTTEDTNIEHVLIQSAVTFIERAQKLNGTPFEHQLPSIKANLVVSFTLLFKTPQDLRAYLETFEQK